MEKSDAITAVCRALSRARSKEDTSEAVRILQEHYPFSPEATTKVKYGAIESTRVFVRDGFIDRYSGDRLIFPPVFRVLSTALPSDFPYHPAWKTDATHPAYLEVGATIDHLVPVTRGGADDDSNWMTTSMAHNFAKMNWTLEELGWKLHPPGDMRVWDGLIHWFLEYTAAHPDKLDNATVRKWHRAASLVLPRNT